MKINGGRDEIANTKMKILIDIGHPAHVHFFRYPVTLLQAHGHEVIITSRDKEIALDLLNELGLQHIPLSAQGQGGLSSLGKELVIRNRALLNIVRQVRPDIMAAIGGVFIAHVGQLTRIPSLVFYDTENAHLQNAITYPFASCVIAPRAYKAWLPRRRHVRYAGYHELSYLHPNYFSADRNLAIANGLNPKGDNFLIRLVSWKANHDIGEKGWTAELLRRVISKLSTRGKIMISSEGKLEGELAAYRYPGKISEIHHVMAFCRAFIGESATMASECAVLGVPAIYAAKTGRGYTDEQETRYGLVRNIHRLDWTELETVIDSLLDQPQTRWKAVRQALLDDTIDVATYVADCIESFPEPLHRYRHILQSGICAG